MAPLFQHIDVIFSFQQHVMLGVAARLLIHCAKRAFLLMSGEISMRVLMFLKHLDLTKKGTQVWLGVAIRHFISIDFID